MNVAGTDNILRLCTNQASAVKVKQHRKISCLHRKCNGTLKQNKCVLFVSHDIVLCPAPLTDLNEPQCGV